MKFLSVLTVVIAFTMSPALANAKGGGGGGRGGSVSSSSARSYSAPARSYATRPAAASKPTTKSKSSSWFSSDDEIECSTLKKSKHPADRAVYQRYC